MDLGTIGLTLSFSLYVSYLGVRRLSCWQISRSGSFQPQGFTVVEGKQYLLLVPLTSSEIGVVEPLKYNREGVSVVNCNWIQSFLTVLICKGHS